MLERYPSLVNLTRAMTISNLKAMDVRFTPDQKAFARRTEFLITLDDAKASIARGEGRIITQEAMRQLAEEVKERGRARLMAELTTPR